MVAGAPGPVRHHVVDVLEERERAVVAMSRSRGVDLVTGDGLAEALTGVECIIDVATGQPGLQSDAPGGGDWCRYERPSVAS